MYFLDSTDAHECQVCLMFVPLKPLCQGQLIMQFLMDLVFFFLLPFKRIYCRATPIFFLTLGKNFRGCLAMIDFLPSPVPLELLAVNLHLPARRFTAVP